MAHIHAPQTAQLREDELGEIVCATAFGRFSPVIVGAMMVWGRLVPYAAAACNSRYPGPWDDRNRLPLASGRVPV
jgi:hypothetical protein